MRIHSSDFNLKQIWFILALIAAIIFGIIAGWKIRTVTLTNDIRVFSNKRIQSDSQVVFFHPEESVVGKSQLVQIYLQPEGMFFAKLNLDLQYDPTYISIDSVALSEQNCPGEYMQNPTIENTLTISCSGMNLNQNERQHLVASLAITPKTNGVTFLNFNSATTNGFSSIESTKNILLHLPGSPVVIGQK